MHRWIRLLLVALLVAACNLGGREPKPSPEQPVPIRLGYFANLTHAQAVLGVVEGSLERQLGTKVIPRLFSAGPAAMQALLAGELDLLYIGPVPAINGYLRSEGKALRVIAGAASGGAVFVVREGVDPADLRGLKLATPGLVNTQDIALRTLLADRGLKPRDRGGDVTVAPMAPADLLALFTKGELDGAWVAEPWGARLIQSAQARLAYDERDLWPDHTFATTLLVVRTEFLEAHREEVKQFLAIHLALTQWIQTNPEEAEERLRTALAKLQGRPLPKEIMAEAFGRIDIRSDPMAASVAEQGRRLQRLGLLVDGPEPDLSGLYDLSLLQEVAP